MAECVIKCVHSHSRYMLVSIHAHRTQHSVRMSSYKSDFLLLGSHLFHSLMPVAFPPSRTPIQSNPADGMLPLFSYTGRAFHLMTSLASWMLIQQNGRHDDSCHWPTLHLTALHLTTLKLHSTPLARNMPHARFMVLTSISTRRTDW